MVHHPLHITAFWKGKASPECEDTERSTKTETSVLLKMKTHTQVMLCMDVLRNTLLRRTYRGLLSFSVAVFITDTGENILYLAML